MQTAVRVYVSPRLVEAESLRGGVAVVIDLLRASSTIAAALAAGASGVLACEEVEEARAAAAKMRPGSWVLGGERGGMRIEGFDLGNSPWEYRAESVGGKTVVFTTTNGTRALKRAAEVGHAERVVVGALGNLGAVIREVVQEGKPVHVVCAGVEGGVCLEDVVCAGAFAAGIAEQTGREAVDDGARLAVGAWERARGDLVQELMRSQGGRNLVRIGLGADVEACAVVDAYEVVPEMDRRTGLIVRG